MFDTPYPTTIRSNMPPDGGFAALGDPDSMLTPKSAQLGFDFNDIKEADDFFTLDAYADDSTWSSSQGIDAWNVPFQLSPSPLLSESSTLSTLSSSAPSLCASPHLSPFCLSPALPEVDLAEGFDPFGRCMSSLEPDSKAIEQSRYGTIGVDVIFNYREQDVNDEPAGLGAVQNPAASETLGESYIGSSALYEREYVLNCRSSTMDDSIRRVDAMPASTSPEPDPPCFHLSGTRRAASGTKRRLEALFQDEEDECDVQADVRLSSGVRTKKNGAYNDVAPRSCCVKKRKVQRQKESKAHDNQGSHSNDDDSDWHEPRSKPSHPQLTKRITYADLASSGHPLTSSSVSGTFIPPPADCPSCTRGFVREPDLVRHLRAYHQTRDAAPACAGCGTEFSRMDALTRHMIRGTCNGRKRKRRLRRWEVHAAGGK